MAYAESPSLGGLAAGTLGASGSVPAVKTFRCCFSRKRSGPLLKARWGVASGAEGGCDPKEPGRGEIFSRRRYQPLTGLRKEIASWFWSWISTRSLGCPLYRKTGSCASTDGRPHRVVACLRSLVLQKHWEGVLYIQGRTNSFQHHTKRKPPCATKVTYQSAPISVDVQEPKNAPGCC